MSSFLYTPGKVEIFKGNVDLETDDIRGIPVTSAYSPSKAHANVSSVPLGSRAATAVALSTKQVLSSGEVAAFSADALVFPGVPAGDDIVGLVVYRHSDGLLIGYLDYFSNLPLEPDGRDVRFTFPSSGNYAFAF